jgi:hypothetical protein
MRSLYRVKLTSGPIVEGCDLDAVQALCNEVEGSPVTITPPLVRQEVAENATPYQRAHVVED